MNERDYWVYKHHSILAKVVFEILIENGEDEEEAIEKIVNLDLNGLRQFLGATNSQLYDLINLELYNRPTHVSIKTTMNPKEYQIWVDTGKMKVKTAFKLCIMGLISTEEFTSYTGKTFNK